MGHKIYVLPLISEEGVLLSIILHHGEQPGRAGSSSAHNSFVDTIHDMAAACRLILEDHENRRVEILEMILLYLTGGQGRVACSECVHGRRLRKRKGGSEEGSFFSLHFSFDAAPKYSDCCRHTAKSHNIIEYM